MAPGKSWSLRAGLTLGAAVLAFGLGSGASIAAWHEGPAGHVMGTRGGGGAGEVRGLNERFGSMRVESLSPAGFVRPSVAGTDRPSVAGPPPSVARPPPSVAGSQGPVLDPLRPSVAGPLRPSVVGPRRPHEPPVPPPSETPAS